MTKVISTCLFGESPRAYHRYAKEAPKMAEYLRVQLPEWKFRMYYDETAPKDIVSSIAAMSNTQVVLMPRGNGREGCFWRFLAFDDCEVAVCRDLDFKLQENDLICIREWLETDFPINHIWVAHDRLGAFQRKNRRYYMAGCIAARNLKFSVADLISEYTGDKSVYGADEYFLTEHFIPEAIKHRPKPILMHIEPQPKDIARGHTKKCVELFGDIEEYRYLDKNWVGI